MALSKIGGNQIDAAASLSVTGDLTVDTSTLVVDASANEVGIGTTTPATYTDYVSGSNAPSLVVAGSQPSYVLADTDISGNDGTLGITKAGEDTVINNLGAGNVRISNNGAERMRIDSSGNVGIGMTPSRPLHVQASSGAASIYVRGRSSDGTATMLLHEDNSGNAQNSITGYTDHMRITAGTTSGANHNLRFILNDVEKARFDSNGHLFHGKTSSSISTEGAILYADGRHYLTKSSDDVIICNRLTDDGKVIRIFQDSSEEGHISVSGSTVSYNGGHLSRWSQATDGNRIDGLVKGTVMTNLDQMAEWTKDGVTEDNEQLNCMAVSSVEGDANVAGVFVNWDDDDDYYTADMNVAMTGDMVIRIAQGTTVARGDLLMSAGDGTAKPQGDDLVRSRTIAKVTSTTVSHTYDDGSYLVPCVLMAC